MTAVRASDLSTAMTATEYLNTPEQRSRWTELVYGEVHVNAPRLQHQRIATFLTVEVNN